MVESGVVYEGESSATLSPFLRKAGAVHSASGPALGMLMASATFSVSLLHDVSSNANVNAESLFFMFTKYSC